MSAIPIVAGISAAVLPFTWSERLCRKPRRGLAHFCVVCGGKMCLSPSPRRGFLQSRSELFKVRINCNCGCLCSIGAKILSNRTSHFSQRQISNWGSVGLNLRAKFSLMRLRVLDPFRKVIDSFFPFVVMAAGDGQDRMQINCELHDARSKKKVISDGICQSMKQFVPCDGRRFGLRLLPKHERRPESKARSRFPRSKLESPRPIAQN